MVTAGRMRAIPATCVLYEAPDKRMNAIGFKPLVTVEFKVIMTYMLGSVVLGSSLESMVLFFEIGRAHV